MNLNTNLDYVQHSITSTPLVYPHSSYETLRSLTDAYSGSASVYNNAAYTRENHKIMSPDIAPASVNMELSTGSLRTHHFPLHYPPPLYANNTSPVYGNHVIYSSALHAAHAASYMNATMPSLAASDPTQSHHPFSNAYLKIMQTTDCNPYNAALAPLIEANFAAPPKTASIPNSPTIATAVVPTSPHSYITTRKDSAVQSPKVSEVEMSKSSYNPTRYTNGNHLTGRNHDLEYNVPSPEGQFKIPNGREPTGKQRSSKTNLTQESNEVKGATASNTTTMRTCNSAGTFKKGAYIELTNGSLRRVEDMRTEDFIQCAERSPHHRLTESTVVKICTRPSSQQTTTTVVITFSYDRNRSKADIEVTPEHPFFVYGQGWASYNPDLTMNVYNLKCQRLQVGDICISLTKRETSQAHQESVSHQQTRYPPNTLTGVSQKAQPLCAMPPPVTDLRNYPPVGSITSPIALNSHNGIYNNAPKVMYSYPYIKDLSVAGQDRLRENTTAADNSLYRNHPRLLYSGQQESQVQRNELQTPPTAERGNQSLNRNQPIAENHLYIFLPEQEQPLDASMSRKRRWSAPEHLPDKDLDLHESPRQISRKTTSSSTSSSSSSTDPASTVNT